MEANAYPLQQVLQFNRQLFAPLYQRPYVWDKDKQWVPLWTDIEKLANQLLSGVKNPKPHFLGAIVLEQRSVPVGKPDSRSIIDGQQRLTTIQLLLAAIKDICSHSTEVARYEKIAESLIFNQNVLEEEDKFKVWPTNIDRSPYEIIMGCSSPDEVQEQLKMSNGNLDSRIALAYYYFYATVLEWVTINKKLSANKIEALINAIQKKVRLVVIDMDKEDDAQVIFETLNARGTPLLPSDLVKNYLFHKAQDEGESIESIYLKYWKNFEDNYKFWRQEVRQGRLNRPRLDIFLHHYLTLMLKDDLSSKALFAEYQRFSDKDKRRKAKWFFDSFSTYSGYYEEFQNKISREDGGDREKLFFYRLHVMETRTVYPLLLQLYHEYAQPYKSRNDLINILIDLESFLVRRIVCRLTTQNYNRLFLDLISHCQKNQSFSRKTIREYLLKIEGDSGRWPDDQEFKKAWNSEPIYRSISRPRLRIILLALDSGLGTPKTESYYLREDLTVEHLLPEHWETHWPLLKKDESAEKRMERIQYRDLLKHNIGNLTFLTGSLNPAVSNGTFKNKKREILKHSMINLNRFLQDTNEWNESVSRQSNSDKIA
jgi:uncharacterized protein with ParB-like and HNH nuclease domain